MGTSTPSPRSSTGGHPANGRRGRPVAGTEGERRDHILDSALDQLVETGADDLTMTAVARRASASKETLYRWFGDRNGLFVALIQRNADRSAAAIEARLNSDAEAPTPEAFRVTLAAYGVGLLSLLTGPSSVALNRAAMNDDGLRSLLLHEGRHRVGPIVERYLDRGDRAGVISVVAVGGSGRAFELLYGLLVRDSQIRTLLGERPPSPTEISRRADEAVDQFMTLCTPSS